MRKLSIPILLLAGLGFLATGCDHALDEPALSEADLQAVQVILADAMANRSEGLFSDVNDLVADVGRTGIHHGPRSAKSDTTRFAQYSATYDPETGVHLITYSRSFKMPNAFGALAVVLEYIYEDRNGNFLEFPMRAHREGEVAQITFSGSREGFQERERPLMDAKQRNEFSRNAAWVLSGMSADSDVMRLEGEQVSSGRLEGTKSGELLRSRSYTLSIRLTDVTIENAFDRTSDVARRVTGSMEYDLAWEVLVGDEQRRREASGTIDLAGDGKALLRLMGLRRAFVIDLDSGAVNDR
jgi:hypothetical protein